MGVHFFDGGAKKYGGTIFSRGTSKNRSYQNESYQKSIFKKASKEV